MAHDASLTTTAATAAGLAPKVAEGVASGFVLMALPLLLMGTAVGLGLQLVRTPNRALGGV